MKRQWDDDELREQWTLSGEERGLLANKSGPTRLGFALLLTFFRSAGSFPQHKHDIPGAVIVYVAKQVGVAPEQFTHYDWIGRSIAYHRAQIREFFGFREATVQDGQDLVEWLCVSVLPHDHEPEHLLEVVYQRCRALQVEPPAPTRLERLIRSALHMFEERFCQTILNHLSSATRTHLDALLDPSDGSAPGSETEEPSGRGASLVVLLKADPGRLGLESVRTEVEKLRHLRALGLPDDLFRHTSPKIVQRYRQRATAEPPSVLRAHAAPVRATLLAAFGWVRSQEITDSLVDLLIQLVHKIGAKAERTVEQALLEELKRVTGKTGLLFRLAEAAVAHPEGIVKEVLYPVVSEQTLRDLVSEYKTTGSAYRQHVRLRLRASYSTHYRRMLPHLLDALEFRSNNAVHRPVIRALALLQAYTGSTQRSYAPTDDVPIEGVVPLGWRALVVAEDSQGRERVNRINYEICVLQALREKLRCKEIWVVGANRYRNPEDDLPADFETRRATYYDALRQPLEAETFRRTLQAALAQALDTLDRGVPTNPAVKILRKGNGWIALSPLESQPEPVNLGHLKEEIVHRWPMTNLLDILKETDLRVGFTTHFTSVATRETLDRVTLQRRLLLCLYGLGTNTGLKRIAAGDHDESYADLRYVRRKFIDRVQLRQAIAHVANALFRVRQPHIWGEGTTACASDSKKFEAWDQNLMTEWHIRYGGRGVMIYWHVERKAACIYSQLKTCSSSEVAAMIEGVLRHCTDMTVETNYVDSHGQSEVAFAFCYLLGFRLLPRLKGIHTQKLYRPAPSRTEEYQHLQPVLARPINWTLIGQQYDQMIKYATAFRVGTAETEAILRRFTRSNVQHPTYQALAELGKAVKTIFLCEYLGSEPVRREIHEGLNVVENWNSANSFIFYGKGGEIATNRLEDQEIAVLALHLIQLCLVYINTLMIQRVVAEQHWVGGLMPEDLRALTPLMYSHINPYGTFQLDMQARLELEDGEAAG